MPQYTTRTLFVVVAVVGAFLAGYMIGGVRVGDATEAAIRNRLRHENRELKQEAETLKKELEDCRAANNFK
jgi:hypothetical protein